MCLLCKKVLEEPTSSECGHLFCRECLLSASGKRMGCPNCGQALKKHSPTAGGGEEEALAERLGKMSIRCTHKSAGCTETVPLTELVRHADSECDYRPVRCENAGCGISCPHSALEDHMDRCDHRIVECKVCKARLPRKDMPAHQAVRRCFEELNKRHRVTSARQIKSELRDHRMAMLHRRHQTEQAERRIERDHYFSPDQLHQQRRRAASAGPILMLRAQSVGARVGSATFVSQYARNLRSAQPVTMDSCRGCSNRFLSGRRPSARRHSHSKVSP